MDEDYKVKIACTQVYTLLQYFNEELICLKLPKEVLENLRNNSLKKYKYDIDFKNFDINTLTEEALAMLFILFKDYFADEKQSMIIDKFLNPTKYVPNQIFYNNTLNIQNDMELNNGKQTENKELVVYKKIYF